VSRSKRLQKQLVSATIIGPFPELYFGPSYQLIINITPSLFWFFACYLFSQATDFGADCSKIGS
jgi:hypothetical protein